MSARPLLIVLALLFAGLAILLAGGAILTANIVLLLAAFPLGLTAGLMWHQGTGGMAAELFGSGSRRRRRTYRTPSSRVTGPQRKSTGTENSQTRTRGPETEEFWEEVRREARHRARRRNRERRRRAGDDRTSDRGGRSAGDRANRSDAGTYARGRHQRNSGAASTDESGVTEAYRILDLQPGADETAIRDAYREKAKRLHPDTEDGDAEAFKRVTAAYERLVE